MIHIAFGTDDNYAMPCGITMVSLFENNKGANITIHLLGRGLSPNNKDLLQKTVDKYKAEIVFYDINEESLKSFELSERISQSLSISCCIRLFLAEIIPDNIDKILYLDSDLMVLDRLDKLWNIDIENYSIGGVIEYLTFREETFRDLKYPNEYAYINSGVLLINLKYWRENKVLDKLLEYAESNKENIEFLDQDIINGTLYASTLVLPIKYNIHSFFYRKKTNVHQYQEEMNEALKNPVIVHFTSPIKPWDKGLFHPLLNKYREYKNMSLWKDVPITWNGISFKKKLRYYKRIILYSLGLENKQYVKF